MKLMIWNAAKGGMRSVVEAYVADGLTARQDFRLIHAYADGNIAYKQWVALKALITFIFLLITQKIELVHIHAAMRGSFWRKGLFLFIARAFGVPVVFHLHGSEMKPFYASQGPAGQAHIQRTFEAAARVLVLSESWKTFIGSIAPKARIEVVPNYVNTQPVSEDHKGHANPVNILFLGQIGQRKGVFELIPAMKAVAERHPEVRLIIGGNGQRAEAETLSQSLGLEEQIEFAGWVGPEKRADLLRAADIFILPSHNEGLPMSLLEAMSYGVCVVSTTVGGIPELIRDGDNGVLIAPGDVGAIETALLRLIDDSEARQRMAARGRDTQASTYSDTGVLPQLERIYDSVIAEKGQKA